MISRTHDIGAFAMLLTVAVLYPLPKVEMATIGVALIANIVGGLLPDIDQGTNRLWDMLPGGNLVGKVAKKLFLGHRTLSHSLMGTFITYKIWGWLVPIIFNNNYINTSLVTAALMIGYISHLFLDGLTEEGLPLLFPIKWKFGFPPFKHFRIRTGHWVERWLVFPVIVIYTLWLGITNWEILWIILKR